MEVKADIAQSTILSQSIAMRWEDVAAEFEPEGAKGFEAEMPSGLARFGFWPEGEHMIWAAEAKTKNGWSQMVRHVCERA